ncbi:hypothetical protein VP01_216g2 [Puccinia sorghi]|uniref:Uncharacterized protein n=1 Tax=Puccinia sorghi TaxID=27349 RepID=A0A0L6VA33_9BASI|nr:hypothetical protein VP01_216g2 [Puccinia sorghi]
MPFIEPIEPIELPSVFGLQTSTNNQTPAGTADSFTNLNQSQQNPTTWKGKANTPPQNHETQATHRRTASAEEAVIEKWVHFRTCLCQLTRMELERKITELNQLKNQVALIHLLLFTMHLLKPNSVNESWLHALPRDLLLPVTPPSITK